MKMYRACSGMAAMLLGTTLLLSACGGGDSSGGGAVTGSSACPAGTTVCGTAATGAPMASASVVLHCKNNWNEGTSTDANGEWKYNVPAANLPCAVKVTNGTDTWYAFTLGTGNNIITNLSPLTSLALAQALGAAPDDAWFNTVNPAGNSAQLDAMTAALPAAIAALNTALASYALPAGFNPITSTLTAASGSQAGNAHDHLLEQFKAALNGGDFASLLASFASYETGDASPMPAPSYTPGVSTRTAFFEAFAGDYILKVTGSGAEGSNNTAAKNLFPQDRAITVHIKSNGNVVIDAVGRSITWTAATYNGNVGVGKWAEFEGTASTQNIIRYRQNGSFGTTNDLYITYDPDTGKLQVDPQGFINNEGYASLKGAIFVPPPAPVVTTCTATAGDDKLVFTSGPADFCGFSKSASGNNITHYYQFTSATGSNGITFVKFETNSDDSAVEKVTIENDAYAFGCGVPFAACTGVTVTTTSSHKQFTLSSTTLAVINGASQPITVSGLLIHPVSSAGGNGDDDGGSATPTTPAEKLAAAIGTAFAGTYNLTCNDTPHTVTVNADGTATLDGSTSLAGGTSGRVEVQSANTITGKYLLNYTNASNGAQANLGFIGTSTDTSIGASSIALPGGNGQGCTFISGPGTNSFDRLAALKILAPLSASLSCTGSDQATRNELADGAQTLNLSADGSLTLGSSVSATTTKTSLSSLQVLFGGSFASSSYGSVWYEPSFYSGASVGASNRNLDVRLAGDGSTAKSVRFSGGGLNSQCVPTN